MERPDFRGRLTTPAGAHRFTGNLRVLVRCAPGRLDWAATDGDVLVQASCHRRLPTEYLGGNDLVRLRDVGYRDAGTLAVARHPLDHADLVGEALQQLDEAAVAILYGRPAASLPHDYLCLLLQAMLIKLEHEAPHVSGSELQPICQGIALVAERELILPADAPAAQVAAVRQLSARLRQSPIPALVALAGHLEMHRVLRERKTEAVMPPSPCGPRRPRLTVV